MAADARLQATSRRICAGCGEVYNVLHCPPKTDGVCDKCSGKVVQRDDDTEAAVDRRLDHLVVHIEIVGGIAIDDAVARHEHLYRLDAIVALPLDELAHLARVGGNLHETAFVSEAAGRGDHRPGRDDAWPRQLAAIDQHATDGTVWVTVVIGKADAHHRAVI